MWCVVCSTLRAAVLFVFLVSSVGSFITEKLMLKKYRNSRKKQVLAETACSETFHSIMRRQPFFVSLCLLCSGFALAVMRSSAPSALPAPSTSTPSSPSNDLGAVQSSLRCFSYRTPTEEVAPRFHNQLRRWLPQAVQEQGHDSRLSSPSARTATDRECRLPLETGDSPSDKPTHRPQLGPFLVDGDTERRRESDHEQCHLDGNILAIIRGFSRLQLRADVPQNAPGGDEAEYPYVLDYLLKPEYDMHRSGFFWLAMEPRGNCRVVSPTPSLPQEVSALLGTYIPRRTRTGAAPVVPQTPGPAPGPTPQPPRPAVSAALRSQFSTHPERIYEPRWPPRVVFRGREYEAEAEVAVTTFVVDRGAEEDTTPNLSSSCGSVSSLLSTASGGSSSGNSAAASPASSRASDEALASPNRGGASSWVRTRCVGSPHIPAHAIWGGGAGVAPNSDSDDGGNSPEAGNSLSPASDMDTGDRRGGSTPLPAHDGHHQDNDHKRVAHRIATPLFPGPHVSERNGVRQKVYTRRKRELRRRIRTQDEGIAHRSVTGHFLRAWLGRHMREVFLENTALVLEVDGDKQPRQPGGEPAITSRENGTSEGISTHVPGTTSSSRGFGVATAAASRDDTLSTSYPAACDSLRYLRSAQAVYDWLDDKKHLSFAIEMQRVLPEREAIRFVPQGKQRTYFVVYRTFEDPQPELELVDPSGGLENQAVREDFAPTTCESAFAGSGVTPQTLLRRLLPSWGRGRGRTQ